MWEAWRIQRKTKRNHDRTFAKLIAAVQLNGVFHAATAATGFAVAGSAYVVFLFLSHKVPHRRNLRFALAFFLFGLIHLPVIIINTFATFYQDTATTFYATFFYPFFFAYWIFIRGVGSFYRFSRRTLEVHFFRYVALASFATITAFLLYGLIPAVTVFTFAFLVPADLFIAVGFRRMARVFRGTHAHRFWRLRSYRIGAWLLATAWAGTAILDVSLWYFLFTFPTDFWLLRLSSLGGWYLAKSAAIAMMVLGFLFIVRAERISEQQMLDRGEIS